MEEKILDYFKNISSIDKIPQAFLIGNVNFDVFENSFKKILENFLFKKKVDIYNNPDVFILRQNDALISKKEIKELINNLSLTSQFNKMKIYIIEDCEKLSESVYNSLLKILEEPESGIYAFLLTGNISMVKPTIASRCQKILISSYINTQINSDCNELAKEIVTNIESEGINILANCSYLYSRIKDRNEFVSILNVIMEMYKKALDNIVNKESSDSDLYIILKNNIKSILEKILIINDCINNSKKNLNKNLCIDRFIIQMWRCANEKCRS